MKFDAEYFLFWDHPSKLKFCGKFRQIEKMSEIKKKKNKKSKKIVKPNEYLIFL